MAITACSPDNARNDQAAAVGSPAAAAADNDGMLGAEPASSPSAVAARQTVERYFTLIDQKNYRDAYLLWGEQGGDTRGTLEKFEATFKPYSEYRQQVGEPTAIKVAEGKQYILVTATIDVKNRKTGKAAHREGTVMLRRSADPKETAPDKKDWRIWGTDIRAKS